MTEKLDLVNRESLREWMITQFPSLAEEEEPVEEEPPEEEEPVEEEPVEEEPVERDEMELDGEVAIASTEDTPGMEYRFVVDGTVDPGSSLEDDDTITQNDDGTTTVTGLVGPRGTDYYAVSGYVTSWEATRTDDGSDVHESLYEVRYQGDSIGVWELLGKDEMPEKPPDGMQLSGELEVRSTPRTPGMRYTFEVEGSVQEGASLEEADTIESGEPTVVSGTVGPKGSDAYEVEGYVTSWETVEVDSGNVVDESRYEVAYHGEPVGVWELLGEDEPEYIDSSAAALGGGEHYGRKVTEDDADYVVSSLDDARSTLGSAERGEVVFVDGDAEIYSPSKDERLHVPSGVTLASDRGVSGSEGALIHTDAQYSYGGDGLVTADSDARVTGLRIRGPHPDVRWREHDYDYEMSGVRAEGSGVEVDNNEVYGWAINIRGSAGSHIHHNHSHHANMQGLGYAVSMGGSEGGIIEYNRLEHWRHAVAASGGGGYEVRHNLLDGPAISHAIDQHSPGGTYTDVHHNTSTVMEHDTKSKDPVFAAFRGSTVQNAEVYNNWVQGNTKEPRSDPSGWTDEFIIHPYDDGTGWSGISWSNNHLGTSEPSEDIGCPRESSGNNSWPAYFKTVAGFHGETPDRLTEDDCDVTVSTRDELLDEVKTEGRAVWVESSAEIDLSGAKGESIASGVTIAGDRKPSEEVDGPLLYCDDNDAKNVFKTRGNNIRITGLRFRGPNVEVIDDYNPDTVRTVGLFYGEDCRFDNLEVYGWPFCGFCAGAKNYPVSHEYAYIHFHHNCMQGLGYGLELFNGFHEIHHCYFDYDRHSIAGFGRAENGYVAYKNVVGPNHLSHAFDMHALRQNVSSEDSWVAGGRTEIRNNRFEFTNAISGYPQEAFKIRGIPDDVCIIEENEFQHDEEPTPPTENGDAYHQTNAGDDWNNLEARNNTFGVEPSFEVPDRYKPENY